MSKHDIFAELKRDNIESFINFEGVGTLRLRINPNGLTFGDYQQVMAHMTVSDAAAKERFIEHKIQTGKSIAPVWFVRLINMIFFAVGLKPEGYQQFKEPTTEQMQKVLMTVFDKVVAEWDINDYWHKPTKEEMNDMPFHAMTAVMTMCMDIISGHNVNTDREAAWLCVDCEKRQAALFTSCPDCGKARKDCEGFACTWCMGKGLHKSQFVKRGRPNFFDMDTGGAMCDSCASIGE